MIPGSKQDQAFREFCRRNDYTAHKTLPLFRVGLDKRWILYRHGTKHPQWMKQEKEIFPGWTFSKSMGNAKEQDSYRCICLDCAAYEGVEEQVWYVRRSVFEGCISKIKAGRLYMAKDPRRDSFDPYRQKLREQLRQAPVFD
ncbi:MAG: hypothetical protein ACYC92_02340 [Candidatus Acidiferrales bacterium]